MLAYLLNLVVVNGRSANGAACEQQRACSCSETVAAPCTESQVEDVITRNTGKSTRHVAVRVKVCRLCNYFIDSFNSLRLDVFGVAAILGDARTARIAQLFASA